MRITRVLVSGLLLTALAGACNDRGGSSATPAAPQTSASAGASPSPAVPQPTPSPSATPTQTKWAELVEGVPTSLPEGLVLYYYGGRVPIEGVLPTPMLRARQTPDGLEIYDLSAHFPAVGRPFTRSLDFATGRLALGLCVVGYCGGHEVASDDSQNRLFVSNDGGVTWTEDEPLPRNTFLFGTLTDRVTGDSRLLLARYYPETNSMAFLTWPDGAALALAPPVADASPRVRRGQIIWVTDSGAVYDSAGDIVRAAPKFETALQYGLGVSSLRSSTEVLDVLWWFRDSEGTAYISEIAADGTLGRTVHHTEFDLDVRGRVDGDRIIVLRYDPPAGGIGATYVLDLRDGSFREVGGLRRPQDIDAYPIAVVRGEFAHVAAGNDCLNVREAPGTAAAVVACQATGVLLRITGPEADGWLPVETPGGVSGFASAAFLER